MLGAMSTEDQKSKRNQDATRVLRAYFDYLAAITVATFDPDENDRLCQEYIDIVRRQTRDGRKGGYLNRVRREFRFYMSTMPRFAGLLTALMFVLGGLGAWQASAGLTALVPTGLSALILGFGAAFALAFSRWSLRAFGGGQREKMKDIRLLNFGQLGKEIAMAKQSALDNATTHKPSEGPVNLLRLVMLTRLHFELVRALQIDFDIFADGVNRTDFRKENEIVRMGLVASGVLVLASLTLAPPAGSLWPVASGAIAFGVLAHLGLYLLFSPLIRSAMAEQKALFKPKMTERELKRIGVPALRAREFNWQKRTETKEFLEYVAWLEAEFEELNERLKGQVVVRRHDETAARMTLLPLTDDQT